MHATLSSVPFDQPCVITNVLESPIKSKLLEMGLVEGKELKVLFKAPFGDPIAVSVGDYVLSLRLDEANLIEVEEEKK